MRSSVIGGLFSRSVPLKARIAAQRYRQQKVDEVARELEKVPELLRVTRTVLAGDVVQKFGLTRPEAYRAIFAAEREVHR